MAYFECMVGSAGGGATITVTYNSSFYNKTMTCSNGTKTYTKTTTSSGSTEFKVSDEGTWTITCNGVSKTVNVVLNYSTTMAVTKTITVYGAVGATISFTDAVGSKTVTLNSSGQGSVSITFIPPSQTITFTDTNVAKNPSNLSQNYSKSIAITESTTSIKVMPDGAIYWYGWNSNNMERYDNFSIVTKNTNSINFKVSNSSSSAAGYAMVGPSTPTDVTNYKTANIHITALNTNDGYTQFYCNANKAVGGTMYTGVQVGLNTLNIASQTGNRYCFASALNGTRGYTFDFIYLGV